MNNNKKCDFMVLVQLIDFAGKNIIILLKQDTTLCYLAKSFILKEDSRI